MFNLKLVTKDVRLGDINCYTRRNTDEGSVFVICMAIKADCSENRTDRG